MENPNASSTRRTSAYDILQHKYSDLKVSCVLHWPSRFHLLIWITGFFILLGLTINDFMQALDEYQHNNTASLTTVKTEAKSPNFTICIPHHETEYWDTLGKIENLFKLDDEYLTGNKSMAGRCDLCQGMKENNWDFWNYKNKSTKMLPFNNLDPRTTITEYFIPRLLKDGLNESMLNFEKFPWMHAVMDGICYYFTWTYLDDYADDYKILLNDDSTLNVELLRKNKKENPYISRKDLDGLARYFLKGIENSINGGCMVQNKGEAENSATLAPLKLKTFKIGDGTVCFDLPDNFKGNDFVCTYNTKSIQWNRFVSSVFEIYPTPNMLYSAGAQDKPLYSSKDSGVFSMPSSGTGISEYVYLQYNVDSRVIAKREGKECSEEEYPDVCIAKNQTQSAIENCACVPFPLRYLAIDHPDLPYCNFTHYSSCEKKLKESLTRAQTYCNNKCEYTFYSWSLQKEPKLRSNYTNAVRPRFLIAVGYSKVPYVETVMQIKTTSVQFLSAVGGLLGLYLGGSGLTLVAIAILCINQGSKWYQLKRKGNQNIEGLSFDAWSFLRMVTLFHTLGPERRDNKADNDDTGSEEKGRNVNVKPLEENNGFIKIFKMLEEKSAQIEQLKAEIAENRMSQNRLNDQNILMKKEHALLKANIRVLENQFEQFKNKLVETSTMVEVNHDEPPSPIRMEESHEQKGVSKERRDMKEI